MAGSSLFALIDDIATVLDDVAVMSKVAAKKTAGVLGDDLALNAQQVTGVAADRELPVVWAVALGSLRNKAILVPAALVVSAVLPQAILPLLMLGGTYLCYEGVEKLAHRFLHSADEDAAHHAEHLRALGDRKVDLVAYERNKVRGAIRTDFILSAEIIVITLGTVAAADFVTRVVVVAGIAVVMTVGVYGFVAAIVKLDDAGLYLMQREGSLARRVGSVLVAAAPRLMKGLSVVGTLAMFLVGGGILAHGLPHAHAVIHDLSLAVSGALPHVLHGVLEFVVPLLAEAVLGIAIGAVALGTVSLVGHLRRRASA
ncbi:MAG: DUF808 domain-containing protein [Gammaproteobacteria bacterium]|nr:DUF808 domain-containing protein [Gammaproteobacteria bacterium]MCP5200083.1 DUF808 domain-containing protein [Gammaproteobacteria bacterium]